jgi:hypothetical protein
MEPFDFSRGISARDLLARAVTPEAISQREDGYRAGYRDAWIVCLETFASTMGPEAYTRGWDFWADELRAWIFDRQGQRVTPPQLSYKPEAEEPRKM